MANSCCKGRTQPKLTPEEGGKGKVAHDDSDSSHATSRGVCFHGGSLILHPLQVLIDKTAPDIKGTNSRKFHPVFAGWALLKPQQKGRNMADYFTNFSLVLNLANETEQAYALDLAHKASLVQQGK